ncbi:hypothetical protein AQUCO_01500455v1 [Aquilegia coerulea]|uniref:AAA+ ATPase domain-containing protein n=1 Tax=Aquilegia coerulea TaxID=218851 RepID=A0A2G5DTU3_AQUCA|nr:hypothetical protein AQUCO_01500455v1 [Aquilegia coerulea]
MASTSNTLLSSSFFGTNLHLSPPTPKTSNSTLHLLSLSKRKSQTTKSNLNNEKTNSFSLKNLPSQATLAALIFSSIPQTTHSALAIDTPPSSPQQVIQAEAIKSSSPFSQNLNLTAPKPQTSSDLPDGNQWRYSEFLNAVKKGKVERVRFSKDGGVLQLSAVDGRRASVIVPNDPDLIDILAMNGVDISVSEGETGNGLFNFIGNLLFPVLAFAGLFFLFRGQGGSGGPGGLGGPMDFGRSKSKFQEVPETGVTFADVAGADQAKLELQEVVDFLKNPDKYTALGAKIPKGCLLVGPPGTGKTLLARAVAGEAVGRQRGAGMGGGNDEREQTINQLLTEMDGFSGNSGVIVLAATNRPDVLDSALLRPGRFDRQVTVDRPDVAGRVKILQVHSRGKSLAKDVDFEKVARRTPGFTGADLQNLMNEAAILAARRDLKEISKDEISDALERIIAGPEKKNAVVSEEKKKLVAYHEAGHALVGALMPEYDPVAKISIIPRGQAGGLTFFAPSEERLESGLYSRSYLENQMAVALGGRVAEEVIFGQDNVTTGASNDFMQVSRVARQMVERFGFSKKIGQVAIGGGGGNPFLGQQMSSQKDYSMATADVVDSEVRELVEKAYSRATQIITTHIDILHKLAQLLIEKETVDGEEFMSLFIDGKAELFVA